MQVSQNSYQNMTITIMQDIIAIGIAVAGYLCGATPLAVYAGRWDDFNGDSRFGSRPVASSASAASVSYSPR